MNSTSITIRRTFILHCSTKRFKFALSKINLDAKRGAGWGEWGWTGNMGVVQFPVVESDECVNGRYTAES